MREHTHLGQAHYGFPSHNSSDALFIVPTYQAGRLPLPTIKSGFLSF